VSEQRITEITRENIIDWLLKVPNHPYHGRQEQIEFLATIWPLDTMPSTDKRFHTATEDIHQHTYLNDDWDNNYLLKSYLKLLNCSDELFLTFLEKCVHPRAIRDIAQIDRFVHAFNTELERDGFSLRLAGEVSGWPVHKGVDLQLKEVHNQGRVRSDNLAGHEQDGLRFRSRHEINLYKALKALSVTFAPLPVFLRGGSEYTRLEPDFVVLKDGILLVIELDGATTHAETPVQADKRLGLFKHEGAYIERVEAAECATEVLAMGCAKKLMQIIQKYRTNR